METFAILKVAYETQRIRYKCSVWKDPNHCQIDRILVLNWSVVIEERYKGNKCIY